MKHKTALITDATGFLGSYITRELLEAGYHVKLLVRKIATDGTKERFAEVFLTFQTEAFELKTLLDRIEIIRGGVSRDRLGLATLDYFNLANTVDEVFHCAAERRFIHDGSDILTRTNVAGTELVAKFCITGKLKRLHYISTAYVAGNRRDTVLEDELEKGQSFNNNYERSQYYAERNLSIFAMQHQLPYTIYRPGIITGDATTGYTRNYDNIYMFCKELNHLKAHGMPKGNPFLSSLRIPGDKYSTINLVPVDYVARAIVAISIQAKSINKTFHIVNPSPPTLGELAVWLMAVTGNHRIRVVPQYEYETQPHTIEEQLFLHKTAIFQPYMSGEAYFDSTNTRNLLSGLGIECPMITDDLICKYNQYGVDMNWGRRGQTAKEIEKVREGFEHFNDSSNVVIT